MRPVILAFALSALAAVAGAQTTSGTDGRSSVVMRCQDCGSIESIRETEAARRSVASDAARSGSSSAPAGPIGLVMYIPVGKGSSNNDSYVGSVGNRQWQERTQNTGYEFTVRMDSGNYQFAHK